jgi:hypothetical protein
MGGCRHGAFTLEVTQINKTAFGVDGDFRLQEKIDMSSCAQFYCALRVNHDDCVL